MELNADEIHRTFFKQGPYTHLWIDTAKDGIIRWQYTFMDLGMCHTISDECSASDSPARAFGGRYKAFVRQMHRELMPKSPCTCDECCI